MVLIILHAGSIKRRFTPFSCADKYFKRAGHVCLGTIIFVIGGITTCFAILNRVDDGSDHQGLFFTILTVVIDFMKGAHTDKTATGPEWTVQIICTMDNTPFVKWSTFHFPMRFETPRLLTIPKRTRTCKSPKQTNNWLIPRTEI